MLAQAERPRPCGRGGFKLVIAGLGAKHFRPRPCGRGGFKLPTRQGQLHLYGPRPCGRGGFKHPPVDRKLAALHVPARVGGVDLSFFQLFLSCL